MKSWRSEQEELEKMQAEFGDDWGSVDFDTRKALALRTGSLSKAFGLWKQFFGVLLPVLGDAAKAAYEADIAVDEYRERSGLFE